MRKPAVWGGGFGGLALVVLLGGCALFAPSYDPVLDQKATSAYEAIARLAAEAEAGAYAEPSSYAAASSRYTEIEAQLAVARLRASTLPVPRWGQAGAAREDLVTLIGGCATQVRGLATIHKQAGLAPSSGAAVAMMVSCDSAARAARAMRGQ